MRGHAEGRSSQSSHQRSGRPERPPVIRTAPRDRRPLPLRRRASRLQIPVNTLLHASWEHRYLPDQPRVLRLDARLASTSPPSAASVVTTPSYQPTITTVMCRFTGLINGFVRKSRTTRTGVALHFVHYNSQDARRNPRHGGTGTSQAGRWTHVSRRPSRKFQIREGCDVIGRASEVTALALRAASGRVRNVTASRTSF